MLLSPNILYLESIRLRASGETILVTSLPLKQFSGFSAGGFQSHLVSGHSQARGARPGDHHHPQLQRSKALGQRGEMGSELAIKLKYIGKFKENLILTV